VHTYDAFARPPYPSPIPPMRAPHDAVAGSGTPIYDALYSEWRRLFRALPYDRTGEENFEVHALFRGWLPACDHRSAPVPHGNGRHREQGPAALPPGPSAAHTNRMRGL
jgi:hypothetical protein